MQPHIALNLYKVIYLHAWRGSLMQIIAVILVGVHRILHIGCQTKFIVATY